MTTPPEVVFDRAFRRFRQEDRQRYRGKADLDRLPDDPVQPKLFYELQATLNTALASEAAIPEHVDHDPFHFDYVDSNEPNALAFCCDGFSFIGVTVPLMYSLWDSASRVARSHEMTALLDIRLSEEQRSAMTVEERTAVAVFRLELLFIVMHEWTHVVHGHVRNPDATTFANEILGREDGNIEMQAREADADGYAVYHMLHNLLEGQERAHITNVLAMADLKDDVQDQLLLSCFIIATAAFFFTCEPQYVTPDAVYRFEHPPQALRMNLMLKNMKTWSAQNKAALHDWLTAQAAKRLVDLAERATWGMNGGHDWSDQVRFLQTAEGNTYANAVETALNQQIRRGYRI